MPLLHLTLEIVSVIRIPGLLQKFLFYFLIFLYIQDKFRFTGNYLTALKNKNTLSKEFINKLAEISAGYLPPQSFDQLIQIIEDETSKRIFDHTSESNFIRILQNRFDKVAFLNDCIKFPHYIEILISISINSNYLTDILVRDPEFFYWISNPSNLNSGLDEENFSVSLNDLTSSFKSFRAKINALRGIKRKELLRIGIKDILNISELAETTGQLSILAKVISAQLFKICYKEVLVKYGLEDINRSYCIVALGKLGGNELNYSSDIDLIIFYDEDSPINHTKEYYEILTEVIYLFIESATSITSSGYIYRVDLRLRPDGRTSHLCRSLSGYLNYYESRGEDWERQMLIKADFVGGDRYLFEKFINYLQPFIYPSSFSISPTEQIKKLKLNIEKELKADEDIKLQSGGIRDIEFAIQALQLLNGGKNRSIRTSNTLTAMDELQKNNLLNLKETADLRASYILYRKIEHYLQLMNDSQTHVIPSDGEILKKLSAYLNFDTITKFKNEVNKRRKIVRNIYNSILGEKKSSVKNKIQDISAINFENTKKANDDFQYLREGKGLLRYKEFDQKSISAFQKIEPLLTNYLKTSLNPDLVLKNFVRVIRYITFPSLWYNEFLDKKFFIFFLNMCEYGQKAIDLFAEDDDLREIFLTRKVFLKLTKNNIKKFSTKEMLFILSAQLNDSLISFTEVSSILAEYFKLRINLMAEEQLDKDLKGAGYCIAAMGSFGAGELTFVSDIDLVFIVKDINAVPEIHKIFQNFLNKLKTEFKPFDVDCRLRPEGASSPLTWELKSYKNYIIKRARTWEFQAFCKLNFICGNKSLFNSLIKFINEKIAGKDNEKIKTEMRDMRRKLYPSDFSSLTKIFNIKKSPGGLLDIDFIVQFLMLTNPDLFKISAGKGIIKTLENYIDNNNNNEDFVLLKKNFIFLKTLEFNNQNIYNNTTSSLTFNRGNLKIFAKKSGFDSNETFEKHLAKVKKDNHSLFLNYLS